MRTAILVVAVSLAAAAAQGQTLREADRVRLAEAFRLAEQVQDSIWTSWSAAPFAVLLLTPEHEFLLRHPRPSDDFTLVGYDSLLGCEVLARATTGRFSPEFLATFPAVGGVPTVVIGTPERTRKSSTLWVITLLHEHFHQLQYSQPDYYEAVAALDLAGGDESGMWMLNYPFPYDSTSVRERHATYAAALQRALQSAHGPEGGDHLAGFLAARRDLRGALTEAQYRYLSFQLWQEGVARYTEYRVAELAAERRAPLSAFQKLPDHLTYAQAADTLRRALEEEMRTLDLAAWERVAFYPTGAAEALLLDAVAPGWRRRYFQEKFYLERYFEKN